MVIVGTNICSLCVRSNFLITSYSNILLDKEKSSGTKLLTQAFSKQEQRLVKLFKVD